MIFPERVFGRPLLAQWNCGDSGWNVFGEKQSKRSNRGSLATDRIGSCESANLAPHEVLELLLESFRRLDACVQRHVYILRG